MLNVGTVLTMGLWLGRVQMNMGGLAQAVHTSPYCPLSSKHGRAQNGELASS
jgi:hypothetical protein